MGFFKLLGVLSPAHISWFTWKKAHEVVGRDAFGNIYYRASSKPGYDRERRWVVYKGAPEASMIPPEWHGWLHYQTDVVPGEKSGSFRRPWQKPHRPNMTGTTAAYRPPGHILKGGNRASATGDYEAWIPSE